MQLAIRTSCRTMNAPGLISKSNTPQQADGASNLQRSRAAGYLTLAAFAKYSCKHGTWLIARGNEEYNE